MPDYQQLNQNQSNSTSSSSSSTSSAEHDEQELVGNQAIVDIIKAQNNPTGDRALNPNKNGIVYMGLNHYAHDESRKLNDLNRGTGGAISATPQVKQDHITKGGIEYDLKTESGAAQYITTLGLPDHVALQAAEFLHAAGGQARDELAQFIRILSEAEMGERKIDRMVLSGHSVGSQIWGDDNGQVSFSELEELFEMFPKAAAQVQHVMLSACYSGGEVGMQRYQGMFAGAESLWAYHGSSPGTWTGAMDHMAEWENATKSGKDAGGVDPELAKGFRKDKNVATWNKEDGYQGGKPMNFHQIKNDIDGNESMFQNHLSGQTAVSNPQSGPLRDYYAMIQRAINHPDCPSEFRTQMLERRDQTIRLLYFQLICTKFQSHHMQTLRRDYQEAGMEVPTFANMTRAEVLAHIAELAASAEGSEALRLLQQGLGNLDSEVIPTSWV
jgi:hypothetical protein